jgi:hypothetical protein
MKTISLLLILACVSVASCTKDTAETTPNLFLKGLLNNRNWQGQVEITYINSEGDLVVGGFKKSTQKNIDSEDIVIYVPDFDGVGEYLLQKENAMYRESCYEDMLCAIGVSENNDLANKVIIEKYDATTGYVEGTVSFTVIGQKEQQPKNWQLKSGKFKAIIKN